MIKNDKQYKSAKAKLEKWQQTRKQLRSGASAGQPEWLVKEQAFGINEQIKQLSLEIKKYDDTASGRAKLPDPALIQEIPNLLISWRIARHWTQRDLAARVGLHENQIQKYESENYGCASLLTISKIAAALADSQKPSGGKTVDLK